jgi:hypothetical protein
MKGPGVCKHLGCAPNRARILHQELDPHRAHRPSDDSHQNRARHVARVRDLTVARWQLRADHGLDAAEQFLVLDRIVGEAHVRFERVLIAEGMDAGGGVTAKVSAAG